MFLLTLSFTTQANTPKDDGSEVVIESHKAAFEMCIFNNIKSADKSTTLAQVETQCEQQVARKILNSARPKSRISDMSLLNLTA
jgi:phospholipase A1